MKIVEGIMKIMEKIIQIIESVLRIMEELSKNDGPELPPVGAQAWKIPNLEANGAQHLLQKE